ncbi:MAG: type IV pilus secretin PilQ [Xanthomonadales bacterium]|nr:type IV pilus secretin PilQ [Xanthomonadales bacterium]
MTASNLGKLVRNAWAPASALALMSLLAAVDVAAANRLEDVQFASTSSGGVDIVLTMTEPAGDAGIFATEEPPRVAIDLPETSNAVEKRRIAVGTGAASAITILEAGGKTRVIVDLFRSTPYETRAQGNQLILSLGAAHSGVAQAVQSSAGSPMDPARTVGEGISVQGIDFRRSQSGGGLIVMNMNREGAQADLRDSGDGVTVLFDKVNVPDANVQRLDVTDFATPVQTVTLDRARDGARLNIATAGTYETVVYQTENEYVLEVNPLADGSVASGPGSLLTEEESYAGTPVTFNFQNIPVRTVLQLIAEESGLNIVAADTVSGNVTLRLVNVPWDQALEIVLRAKGLDQRREGNVVWVAPQAELATYEQALADARLALEQRAELATEYVAINYGSAEDIANLLTTEAKRAQGGLAGGTQGQPISAGFLSARGSVSFDKRTNTLLINDSAEKIQEIKKLIALLDRPVDQVLIESKIVIATQSFARELGASFGVTGAREDSNGNVLATSGSLGSAAFLTQQALNNRINGQSSGLPVTPTGVTQQRLNVNLPVLSPTGSIGFALLGHSYLLDLELTALEEEGNGEVVSSPRVITANQQEAVIKQGDEIGYVKATDQNGFITRTIEFKEVLLELKVTPTITQDGRVALDLFVKKDELAGFISVADQDVPQITKREVTTSVLMDNAQTVVIGGVYEFSNREDVRKVPFLGDVPFLGNLFRKKGGRNEKAELLIFVTPRILTANSSAGR